MGAYQASGEPSPEPRKLRVFVFDDEELIRTMVRSIMERRGYEVLTYRGATACQECNTQVGKPCADIIMCDLRMPGMDGTDFMRHQRHMGCEFSHIAFMSGAWSPTDLDTAAELGCKVLPKPFDMKELGLWLDDCEQRVDLNVPLSTECQTAHLSRESVP